MTRLHATPYDISAEGFFFETPEEFAEKSAAHRNACGQPVEEYEVQFIDGAGLDHELFRALRVHQGNVGAFLNAVDDWQDWEKVNVIARFKLGEDGPDDVDIEIHAVDNLRDLAVQFVEEGLFGDIPEGVACYLDYDAIGADLGLDYTMMAIDEKRYAVRLLW